jgi:oxygen-dependent protoporphyrinogen oxidase
VPPRVIVVGGGVAGLAVAYELTRRAVPFQLLEASGRVGGLIRTEHVDGFTIDLGADSMLAQKPAALALCDELGLGSRLIATTPPRTACVYANDRLHPLPSPSVFGIPTTAEGITSYDLLPPLARAELLRLASCADGAIAGEPADDESVASFFRRQFGADTVSLIAEPLLGGIHAGDVERLSVRAVAPRLVAAADGHPRGCALAALLQTADQSSSRAADGMFRSFPGGMQELVDALAGRIPAGSIARHAGVTDIARDPAADAGAWHCATATDRHRAEAIVIAAPAHSAARMLERVAPVVARQCAQVPYVSTASVALAFPRTAIKHPLDGSGFVVARRHAALRITASTWVSSKWSGRSPAGMVLLRAFLGGAFDPEAVMLDDDALIETAMRDLSGVLGIETAPTLALVHRWHNAGAQHWVGHQARAAALDAELERTPGLFLAGSGYHAIGVPDCIADGRAAGAAAADYVKMRG